MVDVHPFPQGVPQEEGFSLRRSWSTLSGRQSSGTGPPLNRAKALPPPDNELFDACFRIQREKTGKPGRSFQSASVDGMKWGDCNGKRFDERPLAGSAAFVSKKFLDKGTRLCHNILVWTRGQAPCMEWSVGLLTRPTAL